MDDSDEKTVLTDDQKSRDPHKMLEEIGMNDEEISLEAAQMLKEAGNANDDATGTKAEDLPVADDTDEVPAKSEDAPLVEELPAEEPEPEDDDKDDSLVGEGDTIVTRYGEGLVTALAVHPEGMQVRLVITALIDTTAHELSKKLEA